MSSFMGLAIADVETILFRSAWLRSAPRAKGVSVRPGATTLAVTPWLAPSDAATFVSAMSPAFDAAYPADPGYTRIAVPDAIVTIRPQPRWIMVGSVSWRTRNVPVRLMSMMCSHFSTGRSAIR